MENITKILRPRPFHVERKLFVNGVEQTAAAVKKRAHPGIDHIIRAKQEAQNAKDQA